MFYRWSVILFLLSLETSFLSATSIEASPKYLQLDFDVITASRHPIQRYDQNILFSESRERLANSLNRRDNPLQRREPVAAVAHLLQNQVTYYQATLEIGSPPQKVKVILDTGTPDTWVSSRYNPYCANNTKDLALPGVVDCLTLGSFDATLSMTIVFLNSTYLMFYGNNTLAFGTWAIDNLVVGNFFLPESSFVVADIANASTGVLGLGLYVNMGMSLIDKLYFVYEYIKSPIYSLWLNDRYAESGQVLFGAVDHGKYIGTLYTIPVLNNRPGILPTLYPMELSVELSGLSLVDANGKVSPVMIGSVHAFLDSGTSYTYLQAAVVEAIADSIGAEFDPTTGHYNVDCRAQNGDTALIFNFSGANISVALAEILQGPIDRDANDPMCFLLVLPIPDESYRVILGSSFFRSVYMVVDASTAQISIANTKYNSTNTTIEVMDLPIVNGSIDQIWETLPGTELAPHYNKFEQAVHYVGNGSYQLFPPVIARNATGNFRGTAPPAIYLSSK